MYILRRLYVFVAASFLHILILLFLNYNQIANNPYFEISL